MKHVFAVLILASCAAGSRPAQTSADCTPAVETNIRGDYNGWDDEVIYRMTEAFGSKPTITIIITMPTTRLWSFTQQGQWRVISKSKTMMTKAST